MTGETLNGRWTQKMLGRGPGAKAAYRDGWPPGFTKCLRVEVAPASVKGEAPLFIMCIPINDADD